MEGRAGTVVRGTERVCLDGMMGMTGMSEGYWYGNGSGKGMGRHGNGYGYGYG